jgi:release factor glutamine methyltransferase
MPIDDRSEEIYRPNEDTYLLLRAALAEAGHGDKTLEIGCGSGLISRELAARVESLLATDLNPYAARLTKAEGIEVVRADLFRGVKGRFDLIIFNPPYLPTQREERTLGWINFALDGGESGRETIEGFLKDLKEHLRPGGRALLLISSITGPKEVSEMALAEGLDVKEVANERCFFEQLHVLRLEVAHSINCRSSGLQRSMIIQSMNKNNK